MKTKNAREIVITAPHPEDGRYLEVSVGYNEGGPNYFSGGTTPRGYYLRATPITREGTFTKFSLGGADTPRSTLIEQATRFNAKRLAQLAATARQHERYETLIAAFPDLTPIYE